MYRYKWNLRKSRLWNNCTAQIQRKMIGSKLRFFPQTPPHPHTNRKTMGFLAILLGSRQRNATLSSFHFFSTFFFCSKSLELRPKEDTPTWIRRCWHGWSPTEFGRMWHHQTEWTMWTHLETSLKPFQVMFLSRQESLPKLKELIL